MAQEVVSGWTFSSKDEKEQGWTFSTPPPAKQWDFKLPDVQETQEPAVSTLVEQPPDEQLQIISRGIPMGTMGKERALKTGAGLTQFAAGLVPGGRQLMGLASPVPEPETAEERVMGGVGSFTGLLGAPTAISGAIMKPVAKGLAKVAGKSVASEIVQYGINRSLSLGLAGTIQEIDDIKNAPKHFLDYAKMGAIFGAAGLAHIPKHPVMSQIIRQVGGRVMLGTDISKEAVSPENLGQTVFHELLNTFFLSHGETPAKVFAGGIAHGKAVSWIEGLGKDKPTPAEVKAAGGPAKWVGQKFTELAEAAKPVREMAEKEAAPVEEPGVLYSQEKVKPREQLAIPNVTPAPQRVEPFTPEKPYAPDLKAGERPAQGVLPMPDAAPLFKGTEVPSHAAEGGWSPEALKRPMRFFVYDTKTQQTRPLIGVDAVDVQPKLGEVKYQTNSVTGKTEVVDAGPMTNLALARQRLQEKLRAAGQPDVLFSRAGEMVGLPAGMEREGGADRLERGKERAARQREMGMPEPRRKAGTEFTKQGEQDYYERQAVEEAVEAIREGATTYDALDPVYKPLFEKHLDVETLYEVSGGKSGRARFTDIPEPAPEAPKLAPERPVAGRTEPPPPLTTGETGEQARIVPEARPPLGRAPATLPELQSEIVRINEGRVSTEQSAALGALVNGVARYKGMTPDEYVASRFAPLETGEAPPEKPFYGRESMGQFIRDLNKRGITDPKMVEKILNGEPIASVEFLADGKALIRAFRKSNIAGMAHELGHVFRRDLSPAERSLVERACGVKDSKWDRYSEEKWASQFELYLKRGKAPNPELEGVFKKFKSWLGAVYQDIRYAFGPKARIHPNVTRVLDKMIGGTEIRPAEPTKPAGMPKAPLVAGATVGGDKPSPINPVEKMLGPPGEPPPPGAAGITRSVREELQAQPKPPVWGAVKRAIRNPIYLFEKVPVLKKYIRDVDVEAHDNITTQAIERKTARAGWEKLIDKKSRERVWNYAVGQQAGGPETLAAMGMKPVASLTPNETKVYTEIRQNLEKMHGRINEARTLLGLKPIGKVKDYFTFLRKGEEMEQMGHDLINDPDAAWLTENLNKPTDPSFFKKRGLSKKPLESNLFGIYEHYMGRASKYVEKAPVWANSKLLLETIEYKGPDGKTKTYSWSKENPEWSNDIKKYVEFTIGQKAPSALAYIFGEPGRKAASAINRNMAAAVLSANFRSALIQPTALRNSYIELGRKWLFEGVKRGAFSPRGYKEAIELSRILRGRVFDVHQAMLADGERSLSFATAGEIKRKIANIGIAPLKFLDANAAVITWHGAYARATAPTAKGGLGLTGKDAVRYADDVVTKTQASGAPHDISPIQRTPEGKLASLFQTFVINEWNYLAENAIKPEKGKFTPTEHFWRLYRLAIGTMIVNVIMEDVLKMRSPFPTPERAIVEGIRGGEKAGKVAVDVAREFGEQIPILGGSIRWTTPQRVALPAVAQLGYDAGRVVAKGLNAISEHDLSKMGVADLAVLGQMFGVPGTSQALKTLRRRQQGGGWLQSITGAKMESLGSSPAGLSKADNALLDKYGVGAGGARTAPKKKNQKAIDDLMKKYGVKK